MLSDLKNKGIATYTLPNIKFDANRFIEQQVEFIDRTKSLRITARGLMGNPSSQHCEEIRRIRHSIYDQLQPELQKVFPGMYIQFLVCRTSVRYPNTSVAGEDWHRDTSGKLEEGTRIFGGWFNLNTEVDDPHQTQYFSHVPYTWFDAPPSGNHGFDRLSEEDTARYKRMRRVVSVPPNHGVIFDENTVHDVKSDKRPKNSKSTWRIHIKVKVSPNNNVTFGRDVILSRLENQAMMPLNLTDECPMYDVRHMQYWKAKVAEFSKNVNPVFLAKDKIHVKRFVQGLREANEVDPTIGLHPPYTEREIAHLLPVYMPQNDQADKKEEEDVYPDPECFDPILYRFLVI